MNAPTPDQLKGIAKLHKLLMKPEKSKTLWHARCANAWLKIAQPFTVEADARVADAYEGIADFTVQCNEDIFKYWSQQNAYKTHIKRLQDQCRVLGEVIAEERVLRQKAMAFAEKQFAKQSTMFKKAKSLWKHLTGRKAKLPKDFDKMAPGSSYMVYRDYIQTKKDDDK